MYISSLKIETNEFNQTQTNKLVLSSSTWCLIEESRSVWVPQISEVPQTHYVSRRSLDPSEEGDVDEPRFGHLQWDSMEMWSSDHKFSFVITSV